MKPSAYNAIAVPIAVFEAYSFKCYFNVLVTNIGGPDATVRLLLSNDKPLACGPCCPSDKKVFYNRILWSLFHFMYTRVIFVILAVIFQHKRAIFLIFSFIAFVLIAFSVLSIVNFFENVYTACDNLKAVSKFFVIKVSVGLIVIQGIIVEVLVSINKVPSGDRAYRILSKLLLCSL